MASSQQHTYQDWQSTKKTVLERSHHMFNNPFMSDVAFSCEGSDKKFFAHKYVLGTSSAVFHAMFYGKLAEKHSVVHINDTNDENLEEFLRFLYTDECNLTADNTMFMLYLAKKYIVTSLADRCVEFLMDILAVENAFVLLEQAIEFDEKELEAKCWELVDLKTTDVVAAEGFTDISGATLATLLKRQTLKVNEVDLFKAVIKWSEAECSRKEIEANAKNKRIVMGNAIYHIRFASMTAQEFAQNVSQSGILTPEEIILFYDKFCGVERKSETWNMSERKASEEKLLRFCRFRVYGAHLVFNVDQFATEQHALGVSFSKPVKIYGVRLLGSEGAEYNVKLEVFSQLFEKKCRTRKNARLVSGFDVLLPVPIKVQADVIVHLRATTTGYLCLGRGKNGRKTFQKNGVTVTFFDSPDVQTINNGTSVEEGQFDEIIFSVI